MALDTKTINDIIRCFVSVELYYNCTAEDSDDSDSDSTIDLYFRIPHTRVEINSIQNCIVNLCRTFFTLTIYNQMFVRMLAVPCDQNDSYEITKNGYYRARKINEIKTWFSFPGTGNLPQRLSLNLQTCHFSIPWATYRGPKWIRELHRRRL